ncbi:MAG: DUF2760 domain-containing protein [Syntrophobacteraceae bacterium]|nr:DUF2760 domain-containing protein [Syntrophobacteraceae bacterium]
MTCFIINALLVGVFYVMARQVLEGLNQWVAPFLQDTGQSLPADVRSSFSSLGQFLSDSRRYLEPVVFGLGGVGTLLLWLTVHLQGRGLARRLDEAAPAPLPFEKEAPTHASAQAEGTETQSQTPSIPALPSPQPAIQILSIMQRQGRLIDFLQEDLTLYDDAQIGAAVRSIHQGCRASSPGPLARSSWPRTRCRDRPARRRESGPRRTLQQRLRNLEIRGQPDRAGCQFGAAGAGYSRPVLPGQRYRKRGDQTS